MSTTLIVVATIMLAVGVCISFIALSEYLKYRDAKNKLPNYENAIATKAQLGKEVAQRQSQLEALSDKYKKSLDNYDKSLKAEQEKLSDKYKKSLDDYDKSLKAEQEKLWSNSQKDLENSKGRLKAEESRLKQEKSRLEKEESELATRKSRLAEIEKTLGIKEEGFSLEISASEHGFIPTSFEFKDSDTYKIAIKEVEKQAKQLIKNDSACESNSLTMGGSAAAGERVRKGTVRTVLASLNGEVASARSKLTSKNHDSKVSSVKRSFDRLNKDNKPLGVEVNQHYLDLQLRLIELDFEKALRLQEEKDQAKELAEQMREEAKAQKEVEKAAKEAEKVERAAQEAWEKAKLELDRQLASANSANEAEKQALNEKLKQLEAELDAAHQSTTRIKSQAEQTKVGHVYVISNPAMPGSFKVGLTRRLDPEDRISELSGAAVPFKWNLHTLIRSEDAPALESELHRQLDDYRVNKNNKRKEHFRIELSELKSILTKSLGKLPTLWLDNPENYDYEYSISMESSNK